MIYLSTKQLLLKIMKKSILFFAFWLATFSSHAECSHVYTIGAYDSAFKNNFSVTKLGPLTAKDVPPILPKTFLEQDGSYAGGEAFCSIKKACLALNTQLANGILPATEHWHIYLLNAEWKSDTYQLRTQDHRLNKSVKVLKLTREKC